MRTVIFALALVLLSGCVSKDKYVQWETQAPTSFPTLTAVGYAPLATQPSQIGRAHV